MTFIIAEAGVNHDGDIRKAIELVEIAAAAGADAVKFQTFVAEDEISVFAPKAEYQMQTTSRDESQLEMVKRLQFGRSEHEMLIQACERTKIEFMSSAFDPKSIALLADLNLRRLKIPSGEITNLPYLRQIGALGKEIYLSSGMSALDEIIWAMDILVASGTPRELITVLHCNSQYPTPMEDVNLRAMDTMKRVLQTKIGYSDHTLGIEVATAAVAMGAVVIEKHFTTDRSCSGPDHQASLEPKELVEMVNAIRNIEKALGDGVKRPTDSEQSTRAVARKSIVASRHISAGEVFTPDNICTKRPGTGISAIHWDEVLGRVAGRNFQFDELIEL